MQGPAAVHSHWEHGPGGKLCLKALTQELPAALHSLSAWHSASHVHTSWNDPVPLHACHFLPLSASLHVVGAMSGVHRPEMTHSHPGLVRPAENF